MSSVMVVAILRISAHPSAVTDDDGLTPPAFEDLRHPLEFKCALLPRNLFPMMIATVNRAKTNC